MYTENRTACGVPKRTDGCGCDAPAEPRCEGMTWGLRGYPPAMVYAPIQPFEGILDLDTALTVGTVFGALNLPFLCGNKMKGGCDCD